METKRTVLVIDDTLLIRECLCYALEADGYEVYDCEDALSALAIAAENDFHIIITDYRMPNMNGAEATRQLRLRFPASVIIGVSSDDRREDFLAAGADAFLQKPYEYDDLIKLLKAIK
jgi:two-component system chemotaxis response regulator CheY